MDVIFKFSAKLYVTQFSNDSHDSHEDFSTYINNELAQHMSCVKSWFFMRFAQKRLNLSTHPTFVKSTHHPQNARLSRHPKQLLQSTTSSLSLHQQQRAAAASCQIRVHQQRAKVTQIFHNTPRARAAPRRIRQASLYCSCTGETRDQRANKTKPDCTPISQQWPRCYAAVSGKFVIRF